MREANATEAADLAEHAEALENMVIAYTFEAGIIFHSESCPSTKHSWSPKLLMPSLCLAVPSESTGLRLTLNQPTSAIRNHANGQEPQ